MKIIIKSPGEKAIRILIPTRLLCNNFTALIGTKAASKYLPTSYQKLSSKQLRMLFKEFIRISRKYRGLVLVDVESSDGEILKIIL